MSITDEMIAEVLRLDSKATPGYDARGAFCGPFVREKDACLVATYRTAAPALAHEVQRLRAKLDAVRAVLAKYPRQCNGTPAKWNERYLNGDADAVVYRAVLELEAQL